LAVVIDIGRAKATPARCASDCDGTILPLSAPPSARQKLQLYDIVYVKLVAGDEAIRAPNCAFARQFRVRRW
jgi:hypothetical protein